METIKRNQKGQFMKKSEGKWSENFDECVSCGTIQTQHHARGLCDNCYRFKKRHENPAISYQKNWAFKYDRCIQCGETKQKHVGKGLCTKCYSLNFVCIDCGTIVHKENSRCKPCFYKSKMGIKLSIEHKNKLSEARKRLMNEGKLPNLFKSGKDNPMYGQHPSEETSFKKSIAMKNLIKEGKFKSMFKDGHTPWLKGKTAEQDDRIMSKETHWNWQDGKSIEPYTFDFNKFFKEKIRKRDNYCCLICNTPQEELGYRLHVHHVDYDKKNSFPQNASSLCRKHHILTNFNREAWKLFFQKLLSERYGYEYTMDQKIILDFTKTEDKI